MFGRKRRQDRRLTLSPLNRLLPLANYRDIRRLDSWEPLDYPETPYPERAHVLMAVSQEVEALVARDGLDADLGHSVDAKIATWLEQWAAQLDYDATGKARVVRTLSTRSAQVVSARQDDDRAAQTWLAEARAEYEQARALYFGRAPQAGQGGSSAAVVA